jgi:hypothetical protein
MSVIKNCSRWKKAYHRPLCTPKSIDEVGALLRKETSEQHFELGADGVRSRTGVPVLLVEGFDGDLGFIVQTAPARAPKLEPVSLLKGGGLIEMQFVDEPGASSPDTFMLLDLRHRRRGERGLLESIGGIPTPGELIPYVILVSSIEEFNDWKGIEAKCCWQIRGSPSSAEMAAALRAFLHLCAVLAYQPSEERPAPDNFDKHALLGKTNKE